jgi:hypothetical protein
MSSSRAPAVLTPTIALTGTALEFLIVSVTSAAPDTPPSNIWP